MGEREQITELLLEHEERLFAPSVRLRFRPWPIISSLEANFPSSLVFSSNPGNPAKAVRQFTQCVEGECRGVPRVGKK